MACTLDDLIAIRCNDQTLEGPTIQRSVMLQFLCALQTAVDPEAGACDIADLLANAETLVCQGGVARQKMIQAQVICGSEAVAADCSQPVCSQNDIMEAAITILICRLVNYLDSI